MMRRFQILAILIGILILSGCIDKQIDVRNDTLSVPPLTEEKPGIETISGEEVKITPTIALKFKEFRASVSIDKPTVKRGDFLVLMGKIWAPYLDKPPEYEGPKNVTITLLKDDEIILSKNVPLVSIDRIKEISKYFTKKINTSSLSPGLYDLTTHFNTGHFFTVQILVEPDNIESRLCESTYCDYNEKCCNGTCFNPRDGVCVDGTVYKAKCGDEGIFEYNEKPCKKDLQCPEGQVVIPLTVGCWDPGLCSEEAKIGYTKYECTDVVKCNTGWCDNGEICCGGECTPQSTGSSTSFWWCGMQWYSNDLDVATEL